MNPAQFKSMPISDMIGWNNDQRLVETATNQTASLPRRDGHGDASGGGTKISKEMTLLPEDFKPGEHDVICGRGRNIWNSIGNIRFRHLVESRVEEYKKARTKLDKSTILSTIVAEVRTRSPIGGFIRKDPKTGRWSEVGDFLAREKVSQSFRDVLSDSYRSSNKTKRQRRIEEQARSAEINSEMQRIAMEQLRSGQTDKSLYEIICQQQSMLDQTKPEKKDTSSPSNELREDVQRKGILQLSEANLSHTSTMAPVATAPVGRISISPFPVSLNSFQDVDTDRTTYDNSFADYMQRAFDVGNSFDVTNSALDSGTTHSMLPFNDLQQAFQDTPNVGILNSTSSTQQSNMGDQNLTLRLAAVLGFNENAVRDDDPFEPVPLPPDVLAGDIDNLFA
ncbi:Nitrilase family, member 2 [Seminavis robusta]|uniref:Nitrilase family, member 2 n=1 Tax=Seminavis robusta TaxID=568900 RepID=A0A9N8EAM1_9STRA|nr:Nitrilase family, member 2 [Seminavis robusta]|eukprot:Sro889_g216630.1 Nitrilase family, member 2 (394) ;mRNA; f:35049-36403